MKGNHVHQERTAGRGEGGGGDGGGRITAVIFALLNGERILKGGVNDGGGGGSRGIGGRACSRF